MKTLKQLNDRIDQLRYLIWDIDMCDRPSSTEKDKRDNYHRELQALLTERYDRFPETRKS